MEYKNPITDVEIESMTLEELVEFVKANDDNINSCESIIKRTEEVISLAKTQKEKAQSRLLSLVKENNIKEEKVNNLFVTYFAKEDITWLNDTGLLAALKQNGATQFIKTVTTVKESIDKNELKKAFKTDTKLKECYKEFYGTKLTEYVTVTTEENHAKMLEHINEGKKGK